MSTTSSRPRRSHRWVAIIASAAGIAASIAGTIVPSGAAITSPTADQVIRDRVVPLVEDTGGRFLNGANAQLCTLFGLGANSTITVVEVATETEVFRASKGSAGPWAATWTIPEGAAPGLYRVTSSALNRNRASAFNGCQAQTALLSSFTVEYRPWQHTFTDVLGAGTVSLNTSPTEFGFRLGTKTSPVIADRTSVTYFAAPSPALIGAPDDLAGCASDPTSCVPEIANECDPSAGCDPRFIVIAHDSVANDLTGVFDLDTMAFVALATTGGTTRLLASLGTDADATYGDLLSQLHAAGLAQGLDLLDYLASEVSLQVSDGAQTTTVDMSLLEGLQLTQMVGAAANPVGAQIQTPLSLQAGLVVHSYSYTFSGATDPGTGYVIRDSDLVPSLPGPAAEPPSTSPLLIDMGGPLRNVSGNWPDGAGSHLTGGLNVDTGVGEPNGYPIWLPVVSGTGTAPDVAMDFVGHAVVIELPVDIPILDTYIRIGILVGDGLALFNTSGPLPFGIGDIPVLWDEQSPEIVALVSQLEFTITGVLADPTVTEVLDAVLPGVVDLLGGVPTP